MSTFRVYGMTECKALQLARASTPPQAGGVGERVRGAGIGALQRNHGEQAKGAIKCAVRCAPVRQAVYRDREAVRAGARPAHHVPEKSAGHEAQ